MNEDSTADRYHHGGFIAKTDLKTLREGAKKVLVTFREFILGEDGCLIPFDGDLKIGQSLVFREDIELLPAEVIATKIDEDTWYIFAATETPESGFPTTRDAMKVAAAEEKKVRILHEFLTDHKDAEVSHVDDWMPSKRMDAARVLAIIRSVTERFDRCFAED